MRNCKAHLEVAAHSRHSSGAGERALTGAVGGCAAGREGIYLACLADVAKGAPEGRQGRAAWRGKAN